MSADEAPFGTPVAAGPSAAAPRTRRHGWWWKALLVGAGLWILTIVVTVTTLNANLVPTLILIGSFLVPFCVMLFAAERLTGIERTSLFLVFFLAGVFGVLGASLLEAPLSRSGALFVLVGLIEELVKAVILIVAGRRYRPKTAGQGALLGAVVGAGFAAFESAGYAFNAALNSGGISIVSLVQTEVLRAVLTPAAHVLWTAIFGAALFAAGAATQRIRLTLGIAITYVGVALLHALWDSMSSITSALALVLSGRIFTLARFGFLPPGEAMQVQALASVFYVIGLVVVAAIGAAVLWFIVAEGRRPRGRGPASAPPPAPPSTAAA